ncbi:MAG TPA: AAA family ATPase [Actinomycetes bacterium]|jgi:predicted ATPase/DNA-binding SARP family transcriptional activator|nr:AAA family ATPase [Actinomycetes bacterium]
MTMLRVATLGPLRVELDGAPVSPDTRKAVALLAYLAVTGERHSRDVLAGLFWPDQDTAHARGALRRTLSALGKSLGGGWIAADRSTIGLNRVGLELDLARFEQLLADCRRHPHPPEEACHACLGRLAEAAALHRGEFLEGLALRGADGFDEWRFFQAESLRRQLARVLERLARGLAALGEWDDAVAAARRWLALDPLHEPAHQELMLLYAWSGRRAAALRQYRACIRVLDQELGVAPLEETTAVYRTIAEDRPPPPPVPPGPGLAPGGAPAASRAAAAGAPAAAVVPAAGRRPARATGVAAGLPLVGRATEWAALRAAWEGSAAGGRLVVIEGETGIGKTRLGEELAAHAAARGAVVLVRRCSEEERGLAYGPVAELLRAAAARPAATWGPLPDHWLAEAARLVPELGALRPGLGAAPPLDGPGALGRFLDGLRQALLAACRGPLPAVVLLDDLHWADDATLDVVGYLARRLRDAPLCLVVAWRGEQVRRDHRLRRLLAEAQRDHAALHLPLARLDEAAVAELVEAALPAQAPHAGELYRESEGLPLFLAEHVAGALGGDAAGPGPLGVRELLATRVAAVGGTARQVLAAAAVIGRSFDLDTVREASGRGEEETVAALEELAGRGLVRELGQDGYDFVHERLRAAADEQTSLARRRLLHRRVAEALERRAPGRDAGAAAARAARHWHAAGRDAEAAAAFRRAGDHARALYANRDALAHYRSALALGDPDPAGLHEAVGDLETLLGAYDAALVAYETAASLADAAALAGIEHKLGGLHHRRGDWAAAERHFEAALAALEAGAAAAGDDADRDRDGRRARLLTDRSLTAHRAGRSDDAAALAGQALAIAEQAGETLALAQAHNLLGMLAAGRGEAAAAREHLERSLALAETLPDPSARVAALNNLALARGAAGEHAEALRLAGTALGLCAAQGDRHREAALHNNLADLLHAHGDHDAAMTHLKQAVAIFAEVGEPGRLQPEIWKLVEW